MEDEVEIEVIDVKKDLQSRTLQGVTKENNKKKYGKKVSLCRSQKARVFQTEMNAKNGLIICTEQILDEVTKGLILE